MCGRFSLTVPERFFSRAFVFKDIPEMQPNFNIPPGVDIWAVRNSDASNNKEIVKLRWGLVPFWAKDPTIGNRLINARSETLTEKPAFRSAFKSRRCLIPADGFFEWKRDGKNRIPYFIQRKEREPFAMAGLWEKWESSTGDRLESCTILTTAPNELMKGLHDRMPVMLDHDKMDIWLNLDSTIDHLLWLTTPYPAEDMEAFPVSNLVNSPKNKSPECLKRQEILQQEELF
ncbi:MAG: SOS response-associated peptidase [Verrucomicrobia bacterium]|nr:SOS response-associated peptidase [Verrucomicrobiota bacterium]MDA1066906.1 SOS response-associated peptidase [Verrucomicrobiota bacterium]